MAKELKKIGTVTREKMVASVTDRLDNAQACIFIGFNRLPAFPFNQLRNQLRTAGAQVLITKNTLFKLALVSKGYDSPDAFLGTETGLVFVNEADIVNTCKILAEFSQDNEFMNIKGGFINNKTVSAKELLAVAKLPPREALIGMTVSAIASPLTGLLAAMNQIILKFVWVVDEIKKTKEDKK